MIPLVQEFTLQEIKFHREGSAGDGRRDGAAKLADETNTIGEFLTFLDWIGPENKRRQPSEPTEAEGAKTMMNVGIMLISHLHSPVINFGKELFLRPLSPPYIRVIAVRELSDWTLNLSLSLRRF